MGMLRTSKINVLKINVLLVDDDPIWHLVNTRILQHMGFTAIRSAFNGKEALRVLGKSLRPQSDPYVILTDLEMPVLDGLSLIEAIQKTYDLNQYKIVFALLTTSTSTNHKKKARELGVGHYIAKPLTVATAQKVFKSLIPEPIEFTFNSRKNNHEPAGHNSEF
jgi:two-component system chemotaxis response regulator CheY